MDELRWQILLACIAVIVCVVMMALWTMSFIHRHASDNAALIGELKAEIAELQATLKVHNEKPYWWEADDE
jgi:hypothetical protein